MTEPTPQKKRPADRQFRYIEIQKVVDDLTAAAEREDYAETQRLADGYVALVVGYAQDQVDVSRSFLLPTVFSVLDRIERKYPIRSDAREQLADDLVQSLEEAGSIAALVDSFKGALQRLSVIGKAVQGPKIVRLEATLQYLRRNFTERLRLPEVARKAGFSVPAFVRIFRETTGMSFLPFVRALRVEFAKTLLATTEMTVEQIAFSSGFQSQHHLIRSFRTVTGRTPGEFRADNGIAAPEAVSARSPGPGHHSVSPAAR
ncbi:MAG TPA: AraC family transcriptional regulator [Polyangia bacterium]|jgi:AraC-like DNA-binding protein|nr:AraC family transcriptional regulator [Polyangia bacterium]